MCKIIQKIILTGTSKFIFGVQIPSRIGNFVLLQSPGVQPNSREMGAREVNRSGPSSAKVENDWIYASVFIVYLHGMYGDNYTFTCTTSYSL
jgi:hypothetical protein